MNPLLFVGLGESILGSIFGGGSQQPAQSTPYFQAVTQGVSTFSSGVNPAALEAMVDFGGTQIQYNTINALTVGSLMALFSGGVQQALNGLLSTGGSLLLGWLAGRGWSNDPGQPSPVDSGGSF